MKRATGPRNRIVGAIAAVTLVSVVTACGGSTGDTAASSAPSEKIQEIADLVPPSIAETGTLKIAAAAYAPAVIAPLSGSSMPTGFDADMATAVAGILGLKPEYSMIPFDGIITGLQAQRYDLAVGDIGINDERLETVSFVLNHTTRDLLVVPPASTLPASISTEVEACGLTVGAVRGSQEAAVLDKIQAACEAAGKTFTAKTFQDQATVNLAVQQGRIDANLTDEGTAGLLVEQSPDEFKAVEVGFVPLLPTGFALPNNDNTAAMTEAISEALDHLIESGDYAEITGKYFKDGDKGQVEAAEVYSRIVDGAKKTTK
ncbi:hypothetical protein BVC93_24725 [Mycobacterium sp. MS1601]|uniref:transporter substrate-binding domain-containing protein n=1 Tax=Mycobacterium sp. MS1601 TaxID=1936029 RepID=UPI0009791314|nr:transporter substrate-binding domain-containing protein [Mycobacterium sp. MS1601]AQA05078.1 hypothetical protein BVC93_24725 [Mycobacterium sp. MS1601]